MPWCPKCGAGFGYDNQPTCTCATMSLEKSIMFRPGQNEGALLERIKQLEARVAALEGGNALETSKQSS